MSRGFVLSLDAILTVVLMSSFLLATNFFVRSSVGTDWNSVYLQTVSNDILSVSKETGLLQQFLTDKDALNDVLRLTPHNYCAKLSVYKDNELVRSNVKSDCTRESGTVSVTKQLFIAKNHVYLAEVRAWYR